jgi:hypothetical protein
MAGMKTIRTPRRVRHTRDQIQVLLEKLSLSGLSVPRFALQNNLCPGTVRRWVRLHGPNQARRRRPRFVEVKASSLSLPSTVAEIRLADGLTVQLSSSFQVSSLAELIQLLRQP